MNKKDVDKMLEDLKKCNNELKAQFAESRIKIFGQTTSERVHQDTARRSFSQLVHQMDQMDQTTNPPAHTMVQVENMSNPPANTMENPPANPEDGGDLLVSSLQEMFPSVERSVVKSLLVRNLYDQEETVEQLLTVAALGHEVIEDTGDVQTEGVEVGSRVKVPDCPVCLEPPLRPRKIFQCANGHIVCGGCRERMTRPECPTCREPLVGRATVLEQLIHSLTP